MSLLDINSENEKTPAEKRAETLKNHIRNSARNLINDWAKGFDFLWRRNDPQSTLDEIGTDATECFLRSKKMHEFIIEQYGIDHPLIVQEILPRLESIPEFTINEDGTVTIIQEPVEEELIDLEDGE